MPSVPKLACLPCAEEMVPFKNGATIECIAEWGSYYKVKADIWECKSCQNTVMSGFADPLAEHFEPGYQEIEVDFEVHLR